MSLILLETEANFRKFDADWRRRMADTAAELAKTPGVYLGSYQRLVSLQAWRAHLEARISEGSLAFFLEAQNDAITSHVFAGLGSWRSALKALRSCIDNVLFCLYYKDHPIELEMWHAGSHKPTFNDLFTYLENHPLRVAAPRVDAMPFLRAEYSTLSMAVHASAKGFRMTKDIRTTLLWSDSNAERGKWETRETKVITNLNLLLLALFRDSLSGAGSPGVRDSIGLAVPSSLYSDIKAHMKVVLRKP